MRSRDAVRQHAAVRVGGMIGRFLVSPVFYTAAIYTTSGLCFTAAALLLARVLSIADFARVTLLMALLNLSIPLATAGMDGVVVRRTLDLGPRMLRRVMITSAIVALITVTAGYMIYKLDVSLLAVLLPTIVAGGTTFLAAAQYRAMRKFLLSLSLSQSSNYLFLLAPFVMMASGIHRAWFPFLIVLLGYLITAVWVWTKLCRDALGRSTLRQDFPWHDALFFAGTQSAGLLLLGMERLLVPKLLSFDDLATFGVLAAVALAPFRILEMAVGFTLLPRLRAAKDITARRQLMTYEAATVALAVLLGCLAVWYLAPPIAALFVGDKYQLTPALLFAVIVAGSIRVVSGLPRASATAFCTTRELGHLAVLGWLAVGCAFLGALVGARWGIVGIIYGVAFGWLCRGLSAVHIAARYLRHS